MITLQRLRPLAGVLLLSLPACSQSAANAPAPNAPFVDYRTEKPGAMHKITAQDLPAPYATKSATNGPNVVDRPQNA